MAAVLSLACCFAWSARGQAPLVSEGSSAEGGGGRMLSEWRAEAAERALRTGLASTAAALYADLAEAPFWSDGERADLRLKWAASLVAGGRGAEAEAGLAGVPEDLRGGEYVLYRAAARHLRGLAPDAGALATVEASALEPLDRPWLHFLRGAAAGRRGETEPAERAYGRARDAAPSAALRALFESLVFRERIRRAPSDEGIAAELRERWEGLAGEAAAYPYAREYAIVLANLGRREAAIEVINRELANAAVHEVREREQLLLLKAVLTGPATEGGRDALMELVRNGRDREAMSVALFLLARETARPDDEGFTYFLNQLIARPEPHPLLGQLYHLRAQLALRRAELARQAGEAERAAEETALAEADARLLLERFPGMRQIDRVYRLLAYATLRRAPPQYRVAADHLTQLRERVEDPLERAELNRLIGDCYFLNEDFSNAADFYEAARSAGSGAESGSGLFLRLVTAELRAGRIESALRHVDGADLAGGVPAESRWRVEWNVARALREAGEAERALERVRALLGEGGAARVPTYLDLRLRWLLLYLRLSTGEMGEDLVAAAEALSERVRSIPEEGLAEAEAVLLRAEVSLLRARILISTGRPDAGLEALRRLREERPESAAAERSYIVEAEHHAKGGDFASARESLTALAERYPESRLAAEALFEAAVNAERTGTEGYRQAVRLLDQVARGYPDSPLVFHARLRQGDLLRRMNDFAGAQIIYENLINRFPEHPRRYLAELSRADCMLALARDNPGPLDEVALALERLLDLPNLPVDFQVEAGYKWGFALSKRGQPDKAAEVFALMGARFLFDAGQAVRLGPPGKYWMSRILLHLGEIHAQAGDAAEARRIYRQIVAYNLPGRSLAQARAENL